MAVRVQSGNTITLFVEEDVNRSFNGGEVPTEWFQSLNPLFVIVHGQLSCAAARRRAVLHSRRPPAVPLLRVRPPLQRSLSMRAGTALTSWWGDVALVSRELLH
eukprot:6003695-Pyramimonas_sp.AAC.2